MCSPVSIIAWHLFESRLVEQGSVMAILQVILFGRIIAHLKSGAGNKSVVKRLLSKHSSTKKRQSKVYMYEFNRVLCDATSVIWIHQNFYWDKGISRINQCERLWAHAKESESRGMVGLWCMVVLMVRLLFSLIIPKQKGHPNGCPSNTLIKLLLTNLRWLHYFNSALMRMG